MARAECVKLRASLRFSCCSCVVVRKVRACVCVWARCVCVAYFEQRILHTYHVPLVQTNIVDLTIQMIYNARLRYMPYSSACYNRDADFNANCAVRLIIPSRRACWKPHREMRRRPWRTALACRSAAAEARSAAAACLEVEAAFQMHQSPPRRRERRQTLAVACFDASRLSMRARAVETRVPPPASISGRPRGGSARSGRRRQKRS